jgi:hypothetical protein
MCATRVCVRVCVCLCVCECICARLCKLVHMCLNMRLCVFPYDCVPLCHQSDASWGHMSSPGMFTFGNFSITGRTAFVVNELVFFVVRANTSLLTQTPPPLPASTPTPPASSAHTTTCPPMVPHGLLARLKLQAASCKLQAASSCDYLVTVQVGNVSRRSSVFVFDDVLTTTSIRRQCRVGPLHWRAELPEITVHDSTQDRPCRHHCCQCAFSLRVQAQTGCTASTGLLHTPRPWRNWRWCQVGGAPGRP